MKNKGGYLIGPGITTFIEGGMIPQPSPRACLYCERLSLGHTLQCEGCGAPLSRFIKNRNAVVGNPERLTFNAQTVSKI